MDEVAIVGAGIGGLTAALCLHRRGLDVTVHEQASALGEIGAGVQISPNAAMVLQRLGLRDELDAVAARPVAFAVRRWEDDSLIAETPLDGCESRYGAPYYTFHRADLHRVLAEAVPAGVVRTGRRLTDVRADGARTRLRFGDGSEVSADTVIGADGLKSVVRRSLLADEAVFAGQAACRGLVPAERARETADENRVTMWVGPGRHLVCYPVRAGRLLNWALAVPADEATVESWTAEGDPAQALAQLEGWNPRVRALVGATERTLVLPLYDREPSPRLSRDGVTLLGDAAHPMLPFLGQGAGQAIEDGWVLADCLSGLDGSPVAERLRLYERLRSQRADEVQARSRGNSQLLHLEDGEAQRRRDEVLNEGAMAPATFDWLHGYDATTATATALAADDAHA
jgi:salicylate hydroxylase